MSTAMDFYWQLPPISRTVATAVFVTSVGVYTGLASYAWFIFHYSFLFRFPPQIWRLPTSFLITGPNLSILFDTYFIYTYLREIEVGNSRFPRRQDVVWYLICVSLGIIAICEAMLRLTPILSSPFMTFLEGMITALCYTATQDLRGQKTTIYFFTVPSQLMPYCLILMKLLSPGGFVYIPLQVAGILAAHMWDFLTRLWPEFGGGRNLLPTPAFMTSLVTTPRVLRRDFGTAIRPREPGASGSSTGVSSGPLPDSWRTRGPGRRLGGE